MILGNYHRIVFKPSVSSDLYLYTGTVYRVENYPLEWISGNYYTTYKNNTFEVSTLTEKKTAAEYQAVTIIDLGFNNLSTNFTNTLTGKFINLEVLTIRGNDISILEVREVTQLKQINAFSNIISSLDISNNQNIETLFLHNNQLTSLDTSNNSKLSLFSIYNNQLTSLDISNNQDIATLRIHYNNITSENINDILQNLINFNTPVSKNGRFDYDNLTGINGSLENQLINLGWTLIKY